MTFWPRGRRDKPAESLAVAPGQPATPRLAVVEMWTAETRITVGVDLGDGRLSDLLNGGPILRVVRFEVPPPEGTSSIELRADHVWRDLDVEAVLLAFPPPQTTDPRRRLHRPRQLIEFQVGPYDVSGTVHIPPGAQAAGFLQRQGGRFEPVTRAAIRDRRADLHEQRVDVVLVNLHQLVTMHDVGLADSAEIEVDEAPEPQVPSA
ncbi:MAG: hypothetical protein WED12_04750 [Chloroflexota bacterium]